MRTKKIQPEGGPSLWDNLSTAADPQAPQEQPENDTLKALHEVRELAEKTGQKYCLWTTLAIGLTLISYY